MITAEELPPSIPDPMMILTVDPGSERMGYCLLRYYCSAHVITPVDLGTLHGDKLIRQRNKHLKGIFTDSYRKSHVYYDVFREMIVDNSVDLVGCESAFFGKFVTTIVSLTLMINAVRQASHIVLGRDIVMMTPKEAKRWAANEGDASKDTMKAAVLSAPDLIKTPDASLLLDAADEHAYDAAGIGIALCRQIHTLIYQKAPWQLPK